MNLTYVSRKVTQGNFRSTWLVSADVLHWFPYCEPARNALVHKQGYYQPIEGSTEVKCSG